MGKKICQSFVGLLYIISEKTETVQGNAALVFFLFHFINSNILFEIRYFFVVNDIYWEDFYKYSIAAKNSKEKT